LKSLSFIGALFSVVNNKMGQIISETLQRFAADLYL